MDVCPFCHTEVSEDLVRFGGSCPSCLADIPGEEAATDPGEAAREAQHAADRRVVRKAGWVIPSIVGASLASLLCLAVWTVLRPTPVAPMIDFDDVTFAVDPSQFVAYVEPEPEPAPKAAPRRTIRSLEVNVPTGSAPEPLAASGAEVPPSEPGGVRTGSESGDALADAGPDLSASAPQAGGLQFGLDVGVSRRATKGVRLTDDSAIIEMIKGVLTAELPRLKSCYEQRLKVEEGLAGRWVLGFVVGREGNPREVTVTASDRADAELESCVAAKVARWEFQPIRADQPVQKTLAFRPGF